MKSSNGKTNLISSVLRILGVVAIFVVAGGWYFLSSLDMCGDDEIVSIEPSPNGHYSGKLYIKDCGATTSSVTRVDILGSNWRKIFYGSDTVFAKEYYNPSWVKMHWTDNEHFVIEYAGA